MPFTAPSGFRDPRLDALPQEASFKLRKDRQHPGYGTPGCGREIQRGLGHMTGDICGKKFLPTL